MTTTKKPRRAAVAKQAQAPELTADQLRLAKLFAELTDETQEAMLRMMAEMAEKCPRHVRPTLRLIGGGAK